MKRKNSLPYAISNDCLELLPRTITRATVCGHKCEIRPDSINRPNPSTNICYEVVIFNDKGRRRFTARNADCSYHYSDFPLVLYETVGKGENSNEVFCSKISNGIGLLQYTSEEAVLAKIRELVKKELDIRKRVDKFLKNRGESENGIIDFILELESTNLNQLYHESFSLRFNYESMWRRMNTPEAQVIDASRIVWGKAIPEKYKEIENDKWIHILRTMEFLGNLSLKIKRPSKYFDLPED